MIVSDPQPPDFLQHVLTSERPLYLTHTHTHSHTLWWKKHHCSKIVLLVCVSLLSILDSSL